MWQALTQGQQDIVRALSRLQTPTNSSPNNARQIADHMGAGSNSEAVRKAIQPLVKQRVVESAGKGGEGYTLTKAGWICFDQSKIKSE
jgi:DNA-binding IscR family transcriptional regulator